MTSPANSANSAGSVGVAGPAGSVAILGAGPVGLEAALAAADAGWDFTVFESASQVGGNVRRWSHTRLFTPWPMNVSSRMAQHLRSAGRPVPRDDGCPTGSAVVTSLLEPLAEVPALAGRVQLGTRVAAVGRDGLLKHEEIGTDERAARPFRLVLKDAAGRSSVASAGMVLDCTGTYATPNAAGNGGVPAPGEDELGDAVVRALPDLERDRDAWAGRITLLIGAGKSAQTAAAGLAALAAEAPGTQLIWAVRSTDPRWGEVPDDPLPGRQALVDQSRRLAAGQVPGGRVIRGVSVDEFSRDDGRVVAQLHGPGGHEEVVADRVLALTGYVPDAAMTRQLQIHECYATAAPIELAGQLLGDAAGDCLAQPRYGLDVLRNPEPHFFVLGAKSYGRNSQFLLRVGYEQVDDVVAGYIGPGG
jgi:hypothetical protein